MNHNSLKGSKSSGSKAGKSLEEALGCSEHRGERCQKPRHDMQTAPVRGSEYKEKLPGLQHQPKAGDRKQPEWGEQLGKSLLEVELLGRKEESGGGIWCGNRRSAGPCSLASLTSCPCPDILLNNSQSKAPSGGGSSIPAGTTGHAEDPGSHQEQHWSSGAQQETAAVPGGILGGHKGPCHGGRSSTLWPVCEWWEAGGGYQGLAMGDPRVFPSQ